MKHLFAYFLTLPLCLGLTAETQQVTPQVHEDLTYEASKKEAEAIEVSLYFNIIDTKSGAKALFFADINEGTPPLSYTWTVNEEPYDPTPNVSTIILPIKSEALYVVVTVKDGKGRVGKSAIIIDVASDPESSID